jgi:hypothetical protein
LDDQFITLSTNKESIDILPPAKTAVKSIFKHIVSTEVITNNCGNIKSPLKIEPSKIAKINIHNRRLRGPNEANKHKIMVIGNSHSRGSVTPISDYQDLDPQQNKLKPLLE